MKKGVRIGIAVGVLALIIAFMNFSRIGQNDLFTYQEVKPLRSRFVVKVSSTGVIQPENKILISSPVPGRLDDVLVNDGEKVIKGQVLAWMSSQERAAMMDSISTQKLPPKDLKEFTEMYRPTPILAPENGQVLMRGAAKGQSVSVETTLFELSDRLIFVSNLDETDLGKIVVDQAARVKIDAYPEYWFDAKVKRIGHQSSTTNNITTYPVTLEPQTETPLVLRSGMSISVEHILLDKPDTLLLPSWIAGGKQNTEINVLVKKAADTAENRMIKIGLSNGEFVTFEGPLSEQDTLLMQTAEPTKAREKTGLGLFRR